MTETSTAADSGGSADTAGTSTDTAPTQADSYDEGDIDYDRLPDHGGIDDLDEGDIDYGSLHDYGADSGPGDPELTYDDLPDPEADTTSDPRQWEPDETIQVREAEPSSADSSSNDNPEADAARAEVARVIEQGERQDEARAAIDAAYASAQADGFTPNTPGQFNAAAERAIVEAPSQTGSKEVEFEAPTDRGSADVSTNVPRTEQSDAPGLPTEVHTPEEQQVVDDGKAALAVREQSGEVLGGDPVNRADQWHQQGQNDLGYQQDCALASTSAVLRDCGVEASESDVVRQAAAQGLCETRNADPADNGGVRDGEAISELLTQNGIDNQIENPQSADELAEYVEQGKGVITEIDADELWGTPADYAPAYYDADGRSDVNHAVQVTGTVRDSSGELTGIVINDTGNPRGAATVVPTEKWDACWSNTNNDHETVVTGRPTSAERAGR